jgi:hypothetical protein
MAALVFSALVALAIFITMSIGTHRVFSFRRRMRRIKDALDQLRPPQIPPPIQLHSRRPSIMADDEDAPPPMYPGLSEEAQAEEYELMNFSPQRLSKTFSRSVSLLSKGCSKAAQVANLRSSSKPPSRRSSRFSMTRSDDDSDHGTGQASCSRTPPTPMLRTKTPSYTFLKSTTNVDLKDNSE